MNAHTRRRTPLVLGLALLLVGCVTRLAPYDERLDLGAAALQSKIVRFFDVLQQAKGPEERAFGNHAVFYESARADLDALRIQAGSDPGNEQTRRSIELLAKSLASLEELHRKGLSGAELPVLRKLIETQVRMLLQLESAKKREGTEVSL